MRTRIRVARIDGTTLATPGNRDLLRVVNNNNQPDIVRAPRWLRKAAGRIPRDIVLHVMVDDSDASRLFDVPVYR